MRHRILLVVVIAACTGCSRHYAKRQREGPVQAMKSAVARAMHRQVTNAVEAGDGDLRVAALRKQMIADPGNLAARLELASHYDKSGFPELAVEHYRLAAERFQDASSAHLGLAKSLRAMGMVDEAQAVLARFLESHQEAAPLMYSWAGITADEAGNLVDGEEYHRQAIYRSSREDAALHNNLGQNLLLQGRPADAADEFQRALKIHPRSEIARNNLAIALAAHPDEAIVHMRSVTDPATAHSNLAAVLMEQGRYREARAALNIALGYMPGNQAALRNLALLSLLDGGPASAVLKAGKPKDAWRISQERKSK